MKSSLYLLFFTCFIFSSEAIAADKVIIIPLGGAEHHTYWQDQWTVDTSYTIGDGVQYDGSSYVCVEAHQSTAPDSPPSMYWNILALKGAAGATGSQGPKGDTGAQGETGPTGAAGTDGAAGALGETGITGVQGDPGDQGDQGAQGDPGDTGATGAPNFAGPIGQAKGLLIGNEVVGAGGVTWLDRNLGASQVATAVDDPDAYGDLYQWGRGVDGHENRTSPTTPVLSPSDVPKHDNFILAPQDPTDWRSPQTATLWQGPNGINNPCPAGFRLPTKAEWEAERITWSSNFPAGAFASPLKLVKAGYRNHTGAVINAGSFSFYWSSTVDAADATKSHALNEFTLGYGVETPTYSRGLGFSVRCLKD